MLPYGLYGRNCFALKSLLLSLHKSLLKMGFKPYSGFETWFAPSAREAGWDAKHISNHDRVGADAEAILKTKLYDVIMCGLLTATWRKPPGCTTALTKRCTCPDAHTRGRVVTRPGEPSIMLSTDVKPSCMYVAHQ